MKSIHLTIGALAIVLVAAVAFAASRAKTDQGATQASATVTSKYFKPTEIVTQGSVTAEDTTVNYQAVAGTLIVHPKDWDDVQPPSAKDDSDSDDDDDKDKKEGTAEASMFFVYYAKRGADPQERPITFLYNGGPGSSSVWLHMGAFGPKRVVTADDMHTPAAPYQVVNNDYSLLDASDLVFIDAPGTGFSRVAGKDKDKAFYGVDEDGYAFAEFISQFLAKYGRWNSPKYLFGESYGTMRSAVLANQLEADRDVDFNGVILLSEILNYDFNVDSPEENPGVDLPYQLAIPTYAATAWYHHRLPGNPKDLQALLTQAEHFAMTDYALALAQGSSMSAAQRNVIAAKLHQFTGLPDWYIRKANFRINGGEFEKSLEDNADTTTGRLDTRFTGPTMDPLSEEAEYDPQSVAISSAYVSAFNDYVRKQLNYGQGEAYKPEQDLEKSWNFKHQPPDADQPLDRAANVMPDLAAAMKYNPNLRILLNAGYFDLATPYFEGVYELHHLPIPQKLQSNIEYQFYPSGHMVYAHIDSLKALHDHVASFIRKTENLGNR